MVRPLKKLLIFCVSSLENAVLINILEEAISINGGKAPERRIKCFPSIFPPNIMCASVM